MKTKTFFRKYVLVTFLICFAAFILCCIGGYFICAANIDLAKELTQSFAQIAQEKGLFDEEGNVSAVKIFFNNLQATGMGTILGLVPFFFLPVLVLLVNGTVIGGVFALVGSTGENLPLMILTSIVPHGIFEVPAIAMGIGLGITVCLFECEKILGKGRMAKLNALEFFGQIAKLFIIICIPLLLVAAVVEAYVTPVLMNMFL